MEGDEGNMDPCECIGHEMAMRRLLNLLRQTQSYCTNSECFQDVVSPGNPNQDNSFILFGLFLAFATLMYFLRPRNTLERSIKPSTNNDHDGSPPPNPPSPLL
ncbi:small integral membrane protein 14 [Agrilus planipennis]|uniref:Small integral membrane protein 14 n=1 Tax=Agrilus planipennis TaxID=224129 RepID=A0A1W4W6F1_AGRPL|nr:small integral membrane protein 14 [Agrilus planipennis]XP_018319679.1 small integral membrane protein 14 [Agrilus planipennis]XP_018319680.1 small integral membrane protein 14 [Agrilus planipennis]